jgi:hypothetical protein
MACPTCQHWHLPIEVHGWDTEAGLRVKERLARGRAVLAGVPRVEIEGEKARDRQKGAVAIPAKVKLGRPKTPGLVPWKERNRDRLRVYMRDYMRRRRGKVI